MKVEIFWITMVVIFFQRDGLTLYLCLEQTTQGFMIDLNRGKYGIHVNARTMSVV